MPVRGFSVALCCRRAAGSPPGGQEPACARWLPGCPPGGAAIPPAERAVPLAGCCRCVFIGQARIMRCSEEGE
jgi:hypothetical protein